jgi:ABC-type branched-subunit amino acid transport system substrate-binding protein
MKKRLSLVAVVVLCLAPVIGVACGGGEEEEGVKEVKFGLGTPMTGAVGAIIGLPQKHGTELAAEKIDVFTVGGESYRWKIITEDNGWSTAGGVASTTKLIFDHGVKFIYQAGASPGLTARELCEEAGVWLDLTGGRLEHFGPDYPHTFNLTPQLYELQAPSFFRWLTTEHPEVKRVALAQGDDETGYAIADAAILCADYFGLEIVAEEYYAQAMIEFYPMATKLMARNPDIVITGPGYGVLEPMWEMGYEGLDARTFHVPETADAAGWEKVQGSLVYHPQPFGEWMTEEMSQFAAEYEERYGGRFMATPFDTAFALYLLTEVLKKAGTVDDVAKIIETLETETFDTWVGPVKFVGEELIGANHILMWPAPIFEFSGEDLHLIAETPADEAYELALEVYK